MSLSFGARSTPRVCCHQNGQLSYSQEADLINLEHLQSVREEMDNGKVPSLCQGCFELEKNGCISPRHDYLNRYGEKQEEIKVRYLDVTFNNDCNLECLMCSPIYSYKMNNLYHRELHYEREPQWQTELTSSMLKSLLPTLEVITLTGGEPLVSKKIIDFIKLLSSSEFAKSLTLRIYSNLSHIDHDILNLLSRFKKVELLLSIDSVGENYELIRYPAKWDKLVSNIEFLNNNRFPHLDVHLHSVLMSTNWPYIGELIEFYQKYLGYPNELPIFVEIDTPSFLHPGVLPEEQFRSGLEKIEKTLMLLEQTKPQAHSEINLLRRLLDQISCKRDPNLYLQYKVFLSKITAARKS